MSLAIGPCSKKARSACRVCELGHNTLLNTNRMLGDARATTRALAQNIYVQPLVHSLRTDDTNKAGHIS